MLSSLLRIKFKYFRLINTKNGYKIWKKGFNSIALIPLSPKTMNLLKLFTFRCGLRGFTQTLDFERLDYHTVLQDTVWLDWYISAQIALMPCVLIVWNRIASWNRIA